MADGSFVRIGIDLIEIGRVARALERYPGFRERCFTEAERAYCDSRPNPAQHYAARFAGKEAVGKALGSGVYFTWREIEIRGRPKPGVHLSGRTAAWAERVEAGAIELSMTHSRELAAAICVVSERDAMIRSMSPVGVSWAKPGFARREPQWAAVIHDGAKEGAHGGTMGSPVLAARCLSRSTPRRRCAPRRRRIRAIRARSRS